GTRIRVPVTVTNDGNLKIAKGQKISIALYANNADEEADMIELEVAENLSISSLGAGASKTFTLYVELPAGMDAANYEIVAVVDSEDVLEESDEDDNTASTETVIDVVTGAVNLAATVDVSPLPEDPTSGDGTRIRVPVTVTNDGNIDIEHGQ